MLEFQRPPFTSNLAKVKNTKLSKHAKKICKSQLCLRNIQMLSYKEMNNEKKRKKVEKKNICCRQVLNYTTVDICGFHEQKREDEN